jgi:hypothetical protein
MMSIFMLLDSNATGGMTTPQKKMLAERERPQNNSMR